MLDKILNTAVHKYESFFKNAYIASNSKKQAHRGFYNKDISQYLCWSLVLIKLQVPIL